MVTVGTRWLVPPGTVGSPAGEMRKGARCYVESATRFRSQSAAPRAGEVHVHDDVALARQEAHVVSWVRRVGGCAWPRGRKPELDGRAARMVPQQPSAAGARSSVVPEAQGKCVS